MTDSVSDSFSHLFTISFQNVEFSPKLLMSFQTDNIIKLFTCLEKETLKLDSNIRRWELYIVCDKELILKKELWEYIISWQLGRNWSTDPENRE